MAQAEVRYGTGTTQWFAGTKCCRENKTQSDTTEPKLTGTGRGAADIMIYHPNGGPRAFMVWLNTAGNSPRIRPAKK